MRRYQLSISLTVYDQLFFYESIFVAFMNSHFVLAFFWQNNIVDNVARKMLVKLFTGEEGGNRTSVLRRGSANGQ